MGHSFELGIPGTRNVYVFVPSIPRYRSFGHSFSERNFARYLYRFFPLYHNKTIVKRMIMIIFIQKRNSTKKYTDRFKHRITFNYCLLIFYLHSKHLVTLQLIPTCNYQKIAHSNVNITSFRNSKPKRTYQYYTLNLSSVF